MDKSSHRLVDFPPAELDRRVRDRSKFFIACLMTPPRVGTLHFLTMLEYKYFKPGTPQNDNFQLYEITWEEMKFFVCEIPFYMKSAALKCARKTLMRVADGVPVLVDHRGRRVFPLNSPQVFTLEYSQDNPAYVAQRDPDRWRALLRKEMEAVDQIYVECGSSDHPSVVRLQIDAMDWDEILQDDDRGGATSMPERRRNTILWIAAFFVALLLSWLVDALADAWPEIVRALK